MRVSIPLFACLACLSACLTNVPGPEIGGVYACEVDEDCPGSQSCLQQTCEAITLPKVHIDNPEDQEEYTYGGGAMLHSDFLTISATDLALRSLSDSNEAVPGEGHLVVFIDEVEWGKIDTGDLTGGVQMDIEIPDEPGVHRIRVQARLNDGTDYDNPEAAAHLLVWVNDGRQHVALRTPWPNDTFGLETQLIQAEVATLNGLVIGPPASGEGTYHVHVFYDESFPACIDDAACLARSKGRVPDDGDAFGPVQLPDSSAGTVKLTALIMNFDHTLYTDEMGEAVWSQIDIIRTNN